MFLPSGPISHRARGYSRDNAIIEQVSTHRCLNAEQVQVLLFPMTASGKRKCQQRLKRLTDRGRLHRKRYSLEDPYAYHIDRIEQVEHTVLLNWAVLHTTRQLKSWEEIHVIKYNYDMFILITDCFLGIRNTITGQIKFYFLEMDIHHRQNDFDKIRKYNKLYENIPDQWWVPLTKRFPAVMLITDNPGKLKKINGLISRDNKNGLEFISRMVGDIRREVLGCKR